MVATGPDVPFYSIVGLETNLSGFHFMDNGVFLVVQMRFSNAKFEMKTIQMQVLFVIT